MNLNRRTLFSAGGALALSTLLPACGGSSGSSSGSSSIRLLNASPAYASLGLYIDAVSKISDVSYGSASSYSSVTATASTTSIVQSGSTAYLSSASRTLSTDVNYTLVAYGWASALKSIALTDSEAAPSTGLAKFRVSNTATDAGTLSIYLTGETDLLASATPTAGSVIAGGSSAYVAMQAGTYRLRITAAGDVTDLRLDVSGVVLDSTSIMTLLTVPGPSGVLVSALLVAQGGNVTPLTGQLSRVRVIASVGDNALVDVAVGSTSLMQGVRSPTIGSYVSLATGNLPVTVLVNGVAVAASNLAAVAGTDYSLVVTGSAQAPQISLIVDDNRLPSSTTTLCKVRVLHAASGLAASALSLSVNYSALATGVALGTASTYSEQAATSSALVTVDNPLNLQSVYSNSAVALAAGGLYTLFVLTGSSGTVGVLRRER